MRQTHRSHGRPPSSSARPAGSPSSSSGYHSLKSIVSSDSRDEECEGAGNLLDREEEEASRLRQRGGGRGAGVGGGPRRLSDGLPVPPPPKTPPPASSVPQHRAASGRRRAPPPPVASSECETSTTGDESSSSQQRALLSLLQELRSVEGRLTRQAEEHAGERATLVQSLDQQARRVAELERERDDLARRRELDRRRLGGVLTRLDRFATGCWKFDSASVKKMSEALRVQVREWGKAYSVDVSGGLASPGEDAALEATTMEKVQSMHLEIKELKEKNRALRERIKRGAKRRSKHLRGRSGGEVTSGLSQDGDEASHMSGVTHMTGATAITATTSMTAGTKLMDAMSGFLEAHDGDGSNGKGNKGKRGANDRRALTLSTDVPPKSPRPSPRPGGGKKSVSIASSPRSILKQSSKYDKRANEQRSQDSHRPSHGSRQKQPQTAKIVSGPAEKATSQRPIHAARHRTHPGLPKSPVRGSLGRNATQSARQLHGANDPSPNAPVEGFAPFDGGGFANFSNFQFGGDENQGGIWSSSWGGGDEESEV
ncbi:hypothetical protein ACHAWF_002141 [Thalassiosira exigua]